jgi:hypothetical protein
MSITPFESFGPFEPFESFYAVFLMK